MRAFGQGQDVVERLAAILLVDEIPERIACNQSIIIAQMVDFLVATRCYAALKLGFLVTVPVTSDESHQTILEPLWYVVAVTAAQLRTYRCAVHHLAEQQSSDAFSDLCFEMGVVAVEVKNDLCAYDFGDATRVAVFLFLKVDVALLEVALAVEHKELDFLAEATA